MLSVLGLVLVGVSGVSCVWYTSYHFRAVRAEAVSFGEAVADAFVASVRSQLEVMDAAGLERVTRAAGASPLYRSVSVIGRSGRVLASCPPLPQPDPLASEECAECHGQGVDLPHASLSKGRGGERWVTVFQPLEGSAVCAACHASEEGPLGYVHLQVPVSEAFQRLWGETGLVFAVGVVTIVALLFASHFALSSLVLRPLGRLGNQAERFRNGEFGVRFAVEGSEEFTALASTLEAAARRQEGVAGEISILAAQAREQGEQAQAALERLQEGVHLTRTTAEAIFTSVGELNGAIEQTRAHLNAISGSTGDNSTSLIQMSASVDQVAATADQLAQHVSATSSSVLQMVRSVVEVADRIELLARETDATASSMVQIDASTRQIEQNAREAAELGDRMAEAAVQGSRAVEETLRGIHDSHGVIQETARAMGELRQASEAIGGVVKIINEINDKTKLLALNAAIIAAQAGEHGKGFAVVAHEIKNLSDRTATSTGEISRIIRRIRERMEVANEAVTRGEESSARSVELAEKAGESLDHIRSTIQVSHDMTRQILRATEEQSRGSQNVIASMQEVSAMVTYIRQAAQEHRISGEHVTHSTESMRDLTEQVKHATAEQAEVSRYLSEAVSAIDRNLQDLLQAVEREREESENILQHMGRLKEHSDEQEQGIGEVEAVVGELRGQIEGLAGRAGELLGLEGGRG
ncbi:MAG: hypothetical protein Kow0092_08930 [Deferrisomatales bacterium]